jgi:hypothetical protein
MDFAFDVFHAILIGFILFLLWKPKTSDETPRIEVNTKYEKVKMNDEEKELADEIRRVVVAERKLKKEWDLERIEMSKLFDSVLLEFLHHTKENGTVVVKGKRKGEEIHIKTLESDKIVYFIPGCEAECIVNREDDTVRYEYVPDKSNYIKIEEIEGSIHIRLRRKLP